ncbi:molybdopterin molybdochelatase [Hydrobacter penzbergensis]|uniref:Molybdopterin molybdenumtransferase n=1 Tax=Hydrobacter penzbergensis TaxID=1235997 RepID=A0A8X8IF97_9BACT|nr:gephyrin-like molybdotransferase Glp [Hydrobacter penzbergensis]SDW63756.1 molybdopterin molybdochelatase [Hydrobacter penzbergensis]
MISVTEAKKRIAEAFHALEPVTMHLADAAGKVLAEDLHAPFDIPAFAQSAMDGYAFAFQDWQPGKPLGIAGEVPAGSGIIKKKMPGKAFRIFTGAPVPAGTDTVIMQEKTNATHDALTLQDEHIRHGANVRPKGSEIKAGEIAMKKSHLLTPASIGFLAGIGIEKATVYPNPEISLIVTGNELQDPGKPLQYGQVYESNSYALVAVLQFFGIESIKVYRAKDDLRTLKNMLQQALDESDMVLLTGGVSVGKYDFVTEAAAACKVESLFHKVKQKPGKPLYSGIKMNKPVFGLPGNPSSVLTCFYEYVLDAISLLNKRNLSLPVVRTPLEGVYTKTNALTHFLKGYYDGSKVTLLDAQESYRMRSFATANCLIKVDEETERCEEGSLVEIHLLTC